MAAPQAQQAHRNNPKKKKGKHRQRPVGGFSDTGPRDMDPPSPFSTTCTPASSPSGPFPSQAAPHSSDDSDQRQPMPAPGGKGGGADADGSSSSSSSSSAFGAQEWGKPTLHLHSHIEGLFKEQDHTIGGSYSDAALEHWRQLDSEKKLEVVSVTRAGVFDALRELHLTAQVDVEGEPGEEAAQAVVKDFLYALEVQDGKFRFPQSPSLEYIGIFVALETNLLLSMEEMNVLQHAVMVWLLLLWRQRLWWLWYLLTLAVALPAARPCAALRHGIRRLLLATFVERRRWHSYVRWGSEVFFVSILAIALTGGGWSRRWYWAAVTMALGQLGFNHQALRTCDAGKGDEQTGVVAARQGLLWVHKVLLLVLAWPAWSTWAVVLFYYFPLAASLVLTASYFGVGVGIRLLWGFLHDYGLARLAPHAKAKLDTWWHEGRDGLNRAAVLAVVALLVVPYTFWRTWDWTPWKGTTIRSLSVLVVSNVVSMEDLQRAWAEAKAGLGKVLGRKGAAAAGEGSDAEEEKEKKGGEGGLPNGKKTKKAN